MVFGGLGPPKSSKTTTKNCVENTPQSARPYIGSTNYVYEKIGGLYKVDDSIGRIDVISCDKLKYGNKIYTREDISHIIQQLINLYTHYIRIC